AERAEGARAEQAAEARLGPAQVQAVADAREERRPRDDRLLGIDLPGMQVDDRRPALGVDALDRPARHPERQEAEVGAARHRAVVAASRAVLTGNSHMPAASRVANRLAPYAPLPWRVTTGGRPEPSMLP